MICELMGVRLHWEDYGSNSDLPPLLLLHGWGCSISHFEPIAKEMSRDRYVIAVDFPAHGQSSRPPEPWGVPEFTALIRAFIDSIGIRGCDLIAHSFGGRIALLLASQTPEYVNRMVLTGCAGLKKEPTEEQKKRSKRYQRKKEILKRLGSIPFLASFVKKTEDGLRKKYGSADYNALDEEMRKTFVKVINQDLRSCLNKIRSSTLLVWGENDSDTPLWMGQMMEKEIADAGLVIFEGDDHFAYLRQWMRFVTVVRTFLR